MKRILNLRVSREGFLVIGVVLSIILGIIVGIINFKNLDTVPATTSDYEAMRKQIIDIQQDHDLLFKTDGNINITDEEIRVELENDECMLIAKYNKSFELLSITKIDKCTSLSEATSSSVYLGVCVFSVLLIVELIIYGIKVVSD